MWNIIFAMFLSLLFSGSIWAGSLRIMTFNVRYPAKTDGVNVWENRRDLLVETIRREDPDIIGTQELFYIQGEFIVENLPEYAWFGISRRGNREDEHMGIFYKKAKFRLIDSGNFWLSESPEMPGSISWGMSLPRMVTWGLFESATRKQFFVYNTHFAHRVEDVVARKRSAELISERVSQLSTSVPLILIGDFNAPARGESHTVLLSHAAGRLGAGGESIRSRRYFQRLRRKNDWR